MTPLEVQRQRRLAQHYLRGGETPAHLQSTITVAAQTLGFPHGQINILDDADLYAVSNYELSDIRVLPREQTMCQFVVENGDVLAIEDVRDHSRYEHIPGVRDGVVGSYLGVPLRSREDAVVGTLCVLDPMPRRIAAADVTRIRHFGKIAEDQLDLLRRTGDGPAAGQESVARLVRAISDGDIVPWYQPVVDLPSGRVTGYEALARWPRAGGFVEQPGRFVSLAEDSDVIMDLDRAVMRRALHDVRRWRERGSDLVMGVNLSTRHLEAADGVEAIVSTTEDAGVEPQGIVLELTETRALADEVGARAAVTELRRLGYRVLLDDFGSGWSSLDWVLRLDVDGLKVDRAVTSAMGSPIGDAVVRALAGLCNELDFDTVIEGVETAQHASMAREVGFHSGQGYFWSPARPAEAIDADLADQDVLEGWRAAG